jgi:hypothetical protein
VILCTDYTRFWRFDPRTDDIELLDNWEAFEVVNKMDQGLIKESDQVVNPRGFDKVLTVLEEV